jgi:hypothetical protein
MNELALAESLVSSTIAPWAPEANGHALGVVEAPLWRTWLSSCCSCEVAAEEVESEERKIPALGPSHGAMFWL